MTDLGKYRAGAARHRAIQLVSHEEICPARRLDIAGISYSDDEFGLDKASQAQRQQIGA